MLDLGPLTGVVARTLGRVRLQRAIEGATAAAAVVFALGAGVRVVQRLFFFRAENEPLWLVGAVLLCALVAWLWPVRRESVAARLDRAHALHDRVRTALDFAARKERSLFMEAAIRDAVARAGQLSPQRAAPLRAPRAGYAALALGVAWIVTGMLPARSVAVNETKLVTRAVALDQDELAGFREELATLDAAGALSPDAARDAAAYRALLDQLARGEVDRAQAIEALLSLEKRLMKQPSEKSADRSALEELAKDLAKSDEALARALSEQNAKAAAEALQNMAKTLAARPPAERARLKEALERVRRRQEGREAASKREAELESLLKKKEAQSTTPEEKRLLDRDKRELERLRRENQAAREKSRELERLERDLAEAAQALGQNALDQAQSAMQKGAQDLNRHAENQGTREQQEELAKQVSQLREMLQRKREQGEQPKGQEGPKDEREERRQRFVMRAGGKDPEDEQTKLVSRKPGEEGKGGDPKQQGSEGKDGKPALELGGEGQGAEIELPGMPQVITETRPTASDEHDTRTLKNATDIESELRDSQVAGTASKGPTRSEVILDAADRGFATAPYRKVYSDYRSHAEEALESEDIPGGYRFYVRRYFQLIRPREERTAP